MQHYPRLHILTQALIQAIVTTVEEDVIEVLRNFAYQAMFERNRLADDRRKRATRDRAIKLNDPKTFSTNVKLQTPVPKYLVLFVQRIQQSNLRSWRSGSVRAEPRPRRPSAGSSSNKKSLSPRSKDERRASDERQKYPRFSPTMSNHSS